jgi:hypothetical protein
MPNPRSLAQQDHLGNSWANLVPPVVNQPNGGGIISTLLGLPLSLASGSMQGGDTADITSTAWRITTGPNGTGTTVWSTTNVNVLTLLTATVPALTLPLGATLYLSARQTSATLGVGPWSADVTLNT